MVQRKSKTRLIAERRKAVQAELQDLDSKIVSLRAELQALDAAEELLARLARLAGESDESESHEESPSRDVVHHYNGVGGEKSENAGNTSSGQRMRLREMAEIVLSEHGSTGVTTRELLDEIRRRWQFEPDPNHLRPLAWRMVKDGRWTKDEKGFLRLLDLSVQNSDLY